MANTQFADADLLVAVRVVGAAQSALDVNPTVADSHGNGSIADAVNGQGFGGLIPRSPMTHW